MNKYAETKLLPKRLLTLSFIIFCLCLSADLLAQCPMCRTAAESNLRAGGTNGRGLNAGILYMLSAPYLIVMTLGLLWWRNQKAKGASE